MTRIFKDPWRSWQRSLKILEDLAKIFKDPWRSCKDPWRSCKDLWRSLKILEDLCKDFWGSWQEKLGSLRIFKDLCWGSLRRSSPRSSRRSLKIFEDLWRSCEVFHQGWPGRIKSDRVMKNFVPETTGCEYFKKQNDRVLKKSTFNDNDRSLCNFKGLILLNILALQKRCLLTFLTIKFNSVVNWGIDTLI